MLCTFATNGHESQYACQSRVTTIIIITSEYSEVISRHMEAKVKYQTQRNPILKLREQCYAERQLN